MTQYSDESVPTVQTDLRANALSLTGATMQAVTHIAPAIAAFFFTQFVVSLAGITAPLAYLIGVIVVLMLGSTLVQLSKHMPSAGGYYTYVSRAIHPRAGFLTAWMYVLYSPVVAGPIFAFFGFILEGELRSNYNIDAPWLWWVSVLVGAPTIALLQYRGIQISAKVMLVLGGIEIAIVGALALTGFLQPGAGGITLDVFNPGRIGELSGFALAVVFSVQGLTGWEASAPLAEETQDPRRNIPRSVGISIIAIGGFLVLVYWGVMTGWGVNDIEGLVGSPVLPALALAHKFWGALWILVLFAFLNSVLAACLATANVGTRMWYGMARSGSFPKALAKVHPTYKTPVNAILVQLALSLGSGIVPGLLFGPDTGFFLVAGLVLALAVLFVYVMANLAVFLFYLRERRAEFNVLLHAVFPLVSTLVLLYATAKSFDPAPAYPFSLGPVVDGIWLAIGIAILLVLRARGREEWLRKAGAVLSES